ncbi:hypothetical protein [Mycolicibacterium thermoresistibile]
MFVAFIPGLLMLATFGLERLEAGLVDDRHPVDAAIRAPKRSPTNGDRTGTDRIGTEPAATNGLARAVGSWSADLDKPALPTRMYVHHQHKTSFQPTRHADRV